MLENNFSDRCSCGRPSAHPTPPLLFPLRPPLLLRPLRRRSQYRMQKRRNSSTSGIFMSPSESPSFYLPLTRVGREQHRQMVLNELETTERDYLNDLEVLIDVRALIELFTSAHSARSYGIDRSLYTDFSLETYGTRRCISNQSANAVSSISRTSAPSSPTWSNCSF